ncbi:MAG: oligopeptide:H+ symporter, partial [Planctomycetota bacterium]
MTANAAPSPTPTSNRRIGMITLFSTEMWERFSFYGMKALLVPFLISSFGFSEAAGKEALGTYMLLVYLSPLFCAVIADRFLNLRMSIYVGAIVMAFGHLLMSWHSATFAGLALIVVGNGFFKPCATNMVGALYPERDPDRSSAYSFFYFGINVGAFLSPFLCGWLRDRYGFEWGFVAAGIGMLIGLAVFMIYEEKLGTAGFRDDEDSSRHRISASSWRLVLGISLAATAVSCALAFGRYYLNFAWTPKWLLGDDVSQTMLFFVRMTVVGFMLWLYLKLVPKSEESRPLERKEIDRIWVIGAVSFAMFLLVIALEQAGGTLNLFAKNHTQETFLGVKVPYEFYQSANPLAVLLFALFTMWFWKVLDKKGIHDLQKLGPGILIVGLVFMLIKGAESAASGGNRVSPAWLLSIYTCIAAAEV